MEETISGYQWAYLLFDSSRLATILISIVLIVYGSFRSIGMEGGNEVGEDGEIIGSNTPFGNFLDGFQTITSSQAVLIPVGASFSLLVMFFFFDSLQFFFAVCTAVLASVAFSFLLLPVFQFLSRPCICNNKISLGICGRFTVPELLSFLSSSFIVIIWFMTGHWILMDALAMGLCVTIIAYIRLPSLKVSTFLLTGLLVYDVFWVFFSAYIFNSNVMVRVATQQATNPLAYIADKLNMHTVANSTPQLSLPGKLVFPSYQEKGRFSMLGLGDIVMPGLLLCFVMRYDNYKRSILPPDTESKVTYFHCSLIGYILGLITATVASEVYRAAQPALLYLVPFTLLPLMVMAYLKGDLRRMWQDPFMSRTLKYMEV